MYKIEYLPIAQEDIINNVRYVSKELANPISAEHITMEIINSINRLADTPYMYSVYYPVKPLKYEYRNLIVKNYIVLYWVNEVQKIVTIARVIYAKRDLLKLID